jgi:hypothetical protein
MSPFRVLQIRFDFFDVSKRKMGGSQLARMCVSFGETSSYVMVRHRILRVISEVMKFAT